MIMKGIRCSLFILFFPLMLMAGKGDKIEKKINREFDIEANGRIELVNKYGNIDVAIGPDNKVKIDIVISIHGGSQRKAQEALDRITVAFEEGNNRISAITGIENASSWISWFNTGKVGMDINYQVLVPLNVFLHLNNKFGNIYVETSDRDIDITLAYGEISLGDINAKLKLDMAYSEGSISQINDGDIQLAYSNLEMEDGKNIRLNLKYSEVKSGTFQKLQLESAYSNFHSISVNRVVYDSKSDDLVFERVNSIDGVSGYSVITIDELAMDGHFDMRYGDLKIQNIHRGFQKLTISTSYTGVDLHFKPEVSFVLDAETNYCDVEYGALKITENIEKTNNRILKGSRGSGGGQIIARMNYGVLEIQ